MGVQLRSEGQVSTAGCVWRGGLREEATFGAVLGGEGAAELERLVGEGGELQRVLVAVGRIGPARKSEYSPHPTKWHAE